MKSRGNFAYGDKHAEELVRKTFSASHELLQLRGSLFYWAYLVSEAVDQVARARRDAERTIDKLLRAATAADDSVALDAIETRRTRFCHIQLKLPCSRQLILSLDSAWPDDGKPIAIEYQLSANDGVRGRCVGFDGELRDVAQSNSFDHARSDASRVVAHAVRLLQMRQEQFAVPVSTIGRRR